MKHYFAAASFAAALIAGAGYGYYWHYVAGSLQSGIDDWAAQQRGLGNKIAFTRDSISGFPLAFRTSFHAVALDWRQAGGTLSVRGDTLQAEMRPWNLRDVSVRSEHPVFLAFADPGGSAQHASLQSGDADIAFFGTGQIRSLSFSALGGVLESRDGNFAAGAVAVSITLPESLPVDYHQPLAAFEIALTALQLPSGQRAVTAEPIEKIAALGSVMGPLRPAISLQGALGSWASAGGIVELRNFNFVQAPLTLAGAGTLTLDESLQPLGALAIRAQGLAETIALLEHDGMIDAPAARTAGTMAKGLARPDAEGHQVVSVSLSLQQGYLWLGPIKLARLPAIGW